MELSRPVHVVVQRHSNLLVCPIWNCPWTRNLSNQVPFGSRLYATLISETTRWIYIVESSMELSKSVVVQHIGLMTLTRDFQGQILNKPYHMNNGADWHGTKGMWIDWKWDKLCGFEFLPDPWPWILKVKLKKTVSQEWQGSLTWNERGV